MTTYVPVLAHPRMWGWPKHDAVQRVPVLPVATALTRKYGTDAHIPAYVADCRLTRDAITRLGSVVIQLAIFDCDDPQVHGTGEPAGDVWRSNMRERLHALAAEHAGAYYYETRGGCRILYALPEPTVLQSLDDAREWRRSYAVALAYLRRRFDIVGDAACSDWQRLYRLPHATRTPGGKPENWSVIGDANRIGTLMIEASAADVEAAKQLSRAFNTPRRTSYEPITVGDGRGVLFHLLQARGLLIERRGSDGTYVVECPNARNHSTGSNGDGSTLLYPPSNGQALGFVHCLHGHCSALDVRDWFGFFSQTEIDEARRAGVRAA